MDLKEKIEKRTATVAIIGQGYVGLPLAVAFASVGFKTYGIDYDQARVARINRGVSDIDDVSNETLRPLVFSKTLIATGDYAILKKADCISICVPTPLNKTKDPDVSYILSAVEGVKKYLRRGQLVVLESTTYPGTTVELILPILESTGLKAGRDFYLAFSPERVDPGNSAYDTRNTPRIVGGVTPACTKIATLFYQQIVKKVIPVSSTQSAEMVKLLENTFRSVNIGLVNEVALMCDRLGIDVWEIIDAAATKPFGFMPFYPGPGLGGHCIPIDPHYLSWKLKSLNYYARFIELAGDINSHMPEYVIERITRTLNDRQKALKGARILVLGVAYKKDIQDLRESPALDVLKLLDKAGADVSYNDPHVPKVKLDDLRMRSVSLTLDRVKKADLIVILTNHSAYDYPWLAAHARLIFDTRNATGGLAKKFKNIVKL
ncbi:MAG: nucleotide sugar dehydrogenase [candidate division Zixibacteria bacterium]|nr:nucleotide sugar dehydrogenase [candidate division Zixibacteria bacterium]